MSYSAVGFIPAVVEGATFCPDAYIVRAQAAEPACHPECPPDWIVSQQGGDTVCAEPPGGPTLSAGCPGVFMLLDAQKGYSYCSASCPSGWARSTQEGVKVCERPSGAAPAPGPSHPPAPSPGSAPPGPARAGLDVVALPWWAYAAGGAAVLGAAVYYARG